MKFEAIPFPWWRTIRRRLTGHARHGGSAGQTRAWLEARVLAQAYYAGLLYLAFTNAPGWTELAGRGETGLLWPTLWMQATGTKTGALLVVAMHLGGALAAAVAPGRRWCRALAALGLLEFAALSYSDGKIGHGTHLWILTSLVLVFLPDWRAGETPRRRVRQEFLNVFWTAHALVLLTYSMSGLGKVLGALWQASQGQLTAFHPQAMALHIADRLLETGSRSPVGLWLVDHVWAAWPLMLGTIYLQFFAFGAIFRPQLLRIWTVGLILFHLATYFTLAIRFGPPVLLLAIWGLASPFAPEKSSVLEVLTNLPLVRIWVKKRP